MTSAPQSWARARRLDADRMADGVHSRTGVRLTVEGPCPGGQVGAAWCRVSQGWPRSAPWHAHSLR
ncbi:hypothetical protein [Streptomyces profundus]|uniref:hypothetical protein n=1 Tax=Streptomyces profundus TaxID=2867410 RepID=UPI001D16757F|nr:hypothetical protein [Streptomyces sp. MA3_2.13]UED87091.1 hypothetical protein K4G22_25185 [Streptomyces sp. MA3_2.13]